MSRTVCEHFILEEDFCPYCAAGQTTVTMTPYAQLESDRDHWQSIAQQLADALIAVLPFAQEASLGGPDIQEALTKGSAALAAFHTAKGE